MKKKEREKLENNEIANHKSQKKKKSSHWNKERFGATIVSLPKKKRKIVWRRKRERKVDRVTQK